MTRALLVAFRGGVQITTILQHAWAEIEHDELGYHSASMVPMLPEFELPP